MNDDYTTTLIVLSSVSSPKGKLSVTFFFEIQYSLRISTFIHSYLGDQADWVIHHGKVNVLIRLSSGSRLIMVCAPIGELIFILIKADRVRLKKSR